MMVCKYFFHLKIESPFHRDHTISQRIVSLWGQKHQNLQMLL